MGGAALELLLMSIGALSALFAVLAIFDQAWELVYAWLGLAIIAETAVHLRWAAEESAGVAPAGNQRRVVGAISFLNSVFVPIVALLHAGFLDGAIGVILAGLIILAAQYRLGFRAWAAPVAKFDGFPAAYDSNGSGHWEAGENFDDVNKNNSYDGPDCDSFTDTNGNNVPDNLETPLNWKGRLRVQMLAFDTSRLVTKDASQRALAAAVRTLSTTIRIRN